MAGGRRLSFHLDGINNQNFVMRDEQTGSWWQQANGEAFLGPLRGRRLRPVFANEVAFAIWRREHPAGRVLRPAAGQDSAWESFSAAWEADTARLPVTSASYDTARAAAGPADPLRRLPPRTIVLGVSLGDAERAYLLDLLRGQGVVLDDLDGVGIAILTAADGRSFRVFESDHGGRRLPLFLELGAASAGAPGEPAPRRWIDGITGSVWDFSGVAVSGICKGQRLRQVPAAKDYWFDWQTYHPHTSVYVARPRGGS
jgi:hypothetical protein